MISQAKGTGVVGYNVQVAVDARHHLIVTHEVTNVGNDRTQLSPMAKAARDAMGKKKIKALADRGYFSAPEIKACDDAGITALVPKSQTSGAKADGRFDRADFIYIARDDQYLCPAGQRAIYRYTSLESANLLKLRTYWSSACPHCPLRKQCTPAPYRRIRRWEHEAVLDRMQRRLDRQLDAMTIRRRTVEHVFGTLKHWMGSTHFQMRRLGNVSTEMSLHVLAYNLKRVIRILGFAKTLRAMKLAGA
jgi:Transposase DDE domain